MMGAIIGDIVGSRFEWDNHKSKDFKLFQQRCEFTDDTVMTLAVAQAILDSAGDTDALARVCVRDMQTIGRPYPRCGWGGNFGEWIYDDNPKPYNSLGNGSAMRVSAVAWAAHTLDECVRMSNAVTAVSHDHPEGLKGAEAIAVATYWALHGVSKEGIKAEMQRYYNLDFTLDAIRPFYQFDVTCMGTCPPAIVAFLESTSFEDAIRNAISIGGDSDTIAACTGAIAEAYYGVPQWMREQAKTFLDNRLLGILDTFERTYPPKLCR